MKINTRTILAVVTSCITAIAQAQECGTTVFESPSFGTTWTVDESPYCVVTDLQINGLTIEPGVVVLIDGPYEIQVLSTITAIGTADAPIIFTAKDQGVPWRGIYFEDTQPGSSLIYCDISYSDRSGITIINSNPVIEYCTISNNSTSGSGGGVYASILSGDLAFINCEIMNNTASGEGGGVYASLIAGDVVFMNCTIRDNASGSNGGGLRTAVDGSGQLVLDHCNVSNNTAGSTLVFNSLVGGGLYATGGDFVIDNCDFVENRLYSRGGSNVLSRGGGAYFDTEAGQCTNSRFIDNQADARTNASCSGVSSAGGGMFLQDGDTWISNTIFAGQILSSNCTPAARIGTGIYVNRGNTVVESCTIARNNESSALYLNTGALTVMNSIVYFNNGGGQQFGGNPATVTYSNIDNGYEGEGNIAFTPVFQGSGTSFCDLMIVPGSPCIDTGNPDPIYNDSQDCSSPPYGTVRNDMGAHGGPLACSWDIELCPSPANLNGDCSVNTQDFIAFLGAWSSGEPIADWNDDGIINTQDFIAYLGDWVAGCP